MNDRLKILYDKAMELPLSPGVYIMHDKNGKIIYVGKSKVLKNRVSQYFKEKSKPDYKTTRMVSGVYDFDYMLTKTEIEALTLENRLIKLHQPKYNIRLKDDKSYPYIKVTVNEDYPKVLFVRRRINDGAKYFGPYSGSGTAYAIIKTIQKAFGIVRCSREFPRDIGKGRPCLYKQLGQCVGVCTGSVSREDYQDIIKDVIIFLRGSFTKVRESLEEKMNFASENLMFEAAANYRDRIIALQKLWEKQKIVGAPDAEYDVISLYTDDICSCLAIFYIRNGCVIDNEKFIFTADQIVSAETITAFLTDLYTKREYIPKDILFGFDVDNENLSLLSDYLSERSQYKVKLRIPEKGDLKALCNIVYDNAQQYAAQYHKETEKDNKTLVKLASMLSLEVVPQRIEAYDISNFGSDNITGGMICVIDGKFKKSEYRTYKIKSSTSQDDYASMREMIERRLSHAEQTRPDLILLDGGKGHVSVIRQLLYEKGIDIPVFGMVKDSYHKTRALTGEDEEISIAREQSVFQLIYKIQEEVHRFTITRMSNAKRKTLSKSSLESIDGIGAAKARALLSHFKNISAVKGASIDELKAVKGISAKNAEAIQTYFNNKDK